MKVILLEDVKSVGKKGEVVTVKDGYAKNFILKKNLGVEATSKNLNDLKLQKQNDEKVAAENLEKAQEFAKQDGERCDVDHDDGKHVVPTAIQSLSYQKTLHESIVA